ncbi:MAG TPA: hypothetical protein PKD20_04175 [Candidatus Saccharibacteria bacterium]|jgi:hypothetical protein|nr:hypothetical protein [Candidatus Saccharibacteria bacterium]
MQKYQNGFAHIILVILLLFVCTTVGLAAVYVFVRDKTTILEGGYSWSTMKQGPYKDKVMYLTSTNPYSWSGKGAFLSEHASVPDVLYKDGTLYVYFVDTSVDGKPEQIGIKTSKDNGITWSDTVFAEFEGIENKVPVDPAPYLLEDGRVRLYYYDIGRASAKKSSSHTIYSAISNDGIHFKQEDGSRFTYDDIYDPDVFKFDDVWRLYVGTGDQKVLTATSTDGLTFTYEGVAYEGGAIPNVIKEGDDYILYTGGIQIATSSDGKTFTKSSHSYNSGGVTADPGVVKLADELYFMAYKTSDNQPTEQPASGVGQPNEQAPAGQNTTPSAPANNGQQQLAPLDPNLPVQAPAQ